MKELNVLCPVNKLRALTPADVLVVYSGKQGCMCGCRGKYNVNVTHLVEAEKDRGYAYGDGEKNQRMVAKVLRQLQGDARTCIQDGSILYVPRDKMSGSDERSYVVYLCKSSAI